MKTVSSASVGTSSQNARTLSRSSARLIGPRLAKRTMSTCYAPL
jgi:hypothetical protein